MNSSTVLVSVCIPNYNGMAFIDECLQSVLTQQGAFRLEIIVHDDNSSDSSLAHIRVRYPNVVTIASQENVGFCTASNRMVEASRGEYLLLLNNDASLLPDAIKTLLSEAQRIQRSAILSLPQYDAVSGQLLDIGSRLDPFLNPVPNRDSSHIDVGMVAGACLWIDKTLWSTLGGFPTWFESIGEDLYLCCRARRQGHPVRALAESGYRHHVGASFGGSKPSDKKLTTSFRRRALSERNKTFVMVMCYPTPAMQLVLPLHIVLLMLEGLILSVVLGTPSFWQRIYWPVFPALIQQHTRLKTLRTDVSLKSGHKQLRFFSAFNWIPHKLTMLVRHGLPIVR